MTMRRARRWPSKLWWLVIAPVVLVAAATIWAVNNAYRIG